MPRAIGPRNARRRPGTPRTISRVVGPVVLAIVIHAAMAAVFLQALTTPRDLGWHFALRVVPRAIDQLHYIEPALEQIDPAPVVRAADDPGFVRRTTGQPRERPQLASSVSAVVPSTLDHADTVHASSTMSPMTGTTAASAGSDTRDSRVMLVPASADPRIWNVRAAPVPSMMSRADSLEEFLARGIHAANDSAAARGVETVRPDLLIERGTRKYGVDNATIHLGKVALPATLLGLLPIAGFGCMPTMYFPDRPVRDSIGISCFQLENPNVAERSERINEMSVEIRARAHLAAESRQELARIAARKDRERARLHQTSARPDTSRPRFPR